MQESDQGAENDPAGQATQAMPSSSGVVPAEQMSLQVPSCKKKPLEHMSVMVTRPSPARTPWELVRIVPLLKLLPPPPEPRTPPPPPK